MIYSHGSLSAVPAYGLQSHIWGYAEEPCMVRPAITWSYKKMTSQLSPDFNKVWSPSIQPLLPPLPCICIFANTGPFYSHLPKQIRAEGRAPTVRAVRLSACRAEWWQKKEKGRGGKKLILREHNPTECLSVRNKCEKKKIIHRQLFWKSVLSQRLNAWVPPAFSVLAIPPLHPRLQRGTCKHIS